jgi:hypothetical protein
MSENNGNNQGKQSQSQSLNRSNEALKKEQRSFDEGYGAVHKMAKEMVENGATLADVLFHANQVWHEFKIGAIHWGMWAITGGMYIDQYGDEATKVVLAGDERYASGVDRLRTAIYANCYLCNLHGAKASYIAARYAASLDEIEPLAAMPLAVTEWTDADFEHFLPTMLTQSKLIVGEIPAIGKYGVK